MPKKLSVLWSFHPSKEGFKGDVPFLELPFLRRFHPSKEGFKAKGKLQLESKEDSFHPSKEGFKGVSPCRGPSGPLPVSIPLRKVSRVEKLPDRQQIVEFPSL